MKKIFFVLCFLATSCITIISQELTSEKSVVAYAGIQNIQVTGKRHNSYFFTFKITKILEGTFSDSIITSNELFHDFGGGQVMTKFNVKLSDYQTVINNDKILVVKFLLYPGNKNVDLVWIAEKHRQKIMERLEKQLTEYYKKEKVTMTSGMLLHENCGRLFFDVNNVPKVAVENGAGGWTIATIDK